MLQAEDAPPSFTETFEGPRGDAGWEVRFRDRVTFVASRVELFRGRSSAEKELYAALEEARGRSWQLIDDPGLGDVSFAATRLRRSTRVYRVAWQDANVVAELEISGPDGLLALSGALELARKQEQRIERAAD